MPRRRLAANAAALAVVVIGILMLSTVVLHTRLSERQLEIDRLEREVASAHGVFDVLRQQRAELRVAHPPGLGEPRLGMHPAAASDFLPVDPWALARVLATRGTIDPNDGTLNESDPLDQVRRVTRRVRRRGRVAVERRRSHGREPRWRHGGGPTTGSRRSRRPITFAATDLGQRDRCPRAPARTGRPRRRAAPSAPTTRCCRRCVTARSATASPRSARHAPANACREDRRRASPPAQAARPAAAGASHDHHDQAPLAQRFGAGRPRRRLIATLVGILVVSAIVLAHVALLQGSSGDDLRSVGAEQWGRTRVLPAQRGAIFDRNGDELALSVPAATVAVNPLQIDRSRRHRLGARPAARSRRRPPAALAAGITSDASPAHRLPLRRPPDRPGDRPTRSTTST